MRCDGLPASYSKKIGRGQGHLGQKRQVIGDVCHHLKGGSVKEEVDLSWLFHAATTGLIGGPTLAAKIRLEIKQTKPKYLFYKIKVAGHPFASDSSLLYPQVTLLNKRSQSRQWRPGTCAAWGSRWHVLDWLDTGRSHTWLRLPCVFSVPAHSPLFTVLSERL